MDHTYNINGSFKPTTKRCADLEGPDFYPTPFSERITFYPKGAKVAGSGTTAYAWYVWDKDHSGTTELAWFKPGYKARYGPTA